MPDVAAFFRLVPDALRAAAELAAARIRLGKTDIRDLVADASAGDSALSERQLRIVERVRYVMPRVAARVPWRSDCLVQAKAAQTWLRRAGIPSEIQLGIRQSPPAGMEAHAWLQAGPTLVTGGDVSSYAPLIRQPPQTPR